MEKVTRPAAGKKKISCKEEFELCYLRHQYLRKAEWNPSEKEMLPYKLIVSQQAKNTFFTYQRLFGGVGMECEDIINIATVQLVSYLSLFAIEQMPAKQEQFERIFSNQKGEVPAKADSLNKNKANFTIFLKQRMEDLVRVCRQKVRNITGFPGDEHYVYVGASKPPKNKYHLKDHHEKYGFNKLDIAVFKTIRKRAKMRGQETFEFDGKWYVSLKFGNKNLTLADFAGADMDPYDSLHNMSPERIYFDRAEKSFWDEKRVEFNNYKPTKRVRMLKSFVTKHKNKVEFKNEVKLARKLLKEIGV